MSTNDDKLYIRTDDFIIPGNIRTGFKTKEEVENENIRRKHNFMCSVYSWTAVNVNKEGKL